ncbi:hypothetical protein [Legionella feeleii]|uniref:Uncharacterized protein n=1 Tax=Legionella feeleii TaxID=453 RepID=A0A378KKA2_9GAMM|nr:hypothetical protein [Legionella feeleii]STX88258.1 Uncharacterised protein [Legionella feeleii]
MPSSNSLSNKVSHFLEQMTHLEKAIPARADLNNRLLRGCYRSRRGEIEVAKELKP